MDGKPHEKVQLHIIPGTGLSSFFHFQGALSTIPWAETSKDFLSPSLRWPILARCFDTLRDLLKTVGITFLVASYKMFCMARCSENRDIFSFDILKESKIWLQQVTTMGKAFAQPFGDTKMNQTQTIPQRTHQRTEYVFRGPALLKEESYTYDTEVIE